MHTFTYLGSTVSSSRIAKAAAVMAKLNKRVWGNDLLSERTKMCIYQACVLSTLLYGSESWTTYAIQKRRLNGFHIPCRPCLLHIKWQDRDTNTEVLERAGSLSMPSLLIQRCLQWLGHAWSLTACLEKSFTENCGRASIAWVNCCCATRTSSSETCDLH